jgi:hypothetical protein
MGSYSETARNDTELPFFGPRIFAALPEALQMVMPNGPYNACYSRDQYR